MDARTFAGKPAPREILANVPRLVAAYYALAPDPAHPAEAVSFGTSGHRGSSLSATFNEAHVLAVAQAVSEVRRTTGVDGPLCLGLDTHALSEPAFCTTLEVLAANGVAVRYQAGRTPTPTPVVSHAIVTYNRGRKDHLADGVVITPSHNPPEDGGFKYNPPHGGPAESALTQAIQDRANALLRESNAGVRRIPFARALEAPSVEEHDFVAPYVEDLGSVVDLDVVRAAKLKLAADPLGGATVGFWDPIAARYGLDIEVVNRTVDPTFAFMTVDHDGKIRMDCSSPAAMQRLIALRERYTLAFGNDPDGDRHGIVTATGLMNPNHYLAAAVSYLFRNRPGWGPNAAVGKTVVTSSMLDRVAARLGRAVVEVPVGFKWFVPGLGDGTLGFAGEESAGASLLRRDGTPWTTDKDGIVLSLLAAEITARVGRDPGEQYRALTEDFGDPAYERVDVPTTAAEKRALGRLSDASVALTSLAGERVRETLTRAPGNGEPIGGIKVVAESAWFAARPSGTENVYKIYAESFRGKDHLARVRDEAQAFVDDVLARTAAVA